MPKKNWGVNSKAAEAKAREAEKKRIDTERKQKVAEDEYWRDDDKHATRKLDRKQEKQKKHEEEIRRKEEARKLLESENEQISQHKTKSAVASRPTKAQVEAAREKAQVEEKKKLGLISADDSVNPKPIDKGSDVSDDDLPPLEENFNRAVSVSAADGSARNVDQAIVLLGDEETDAHPERRMKKAHREFEAAMMEKLKTEYPNMRRSQLKEIIWKEWLRSPQNPLNQATNKTS